MTNFSTGAVEKEDRRRQPASSTMSSVAPGRRPVHWSTVPVTRRCVRSRWTTRGQRGTDPSVAQRRTLHRCGARVTKRCFRQTCPISPKDRPDDTTCRRSRPELRDLCDDRFTVKALRRLLRRMRKPSRTRRRTCSSAARRRRHGNQPAGAACTTACRAGSNFGIVSGNILLFTSPRHRRRRCRSRLRNRLFAWSIDRLSAIRLAHHAIWPRCASRMFRRSRALSAVAVRTPVPRGPAPRTW